MMTEILILKPLAVKLKTTIFSNKSFKKVLYLVILSL